MWRVSNSLKSKWRQSSSLSYGLVGAKQSTLTMIDIIMYGYIWKILFLLFSLQIVIITQPYLIFKDGHWPNMCGRCYKVKLSKFPICLVGGHSRQVVVVQEWSLTQIWLKFFSYLSVYRLFVFLFVCLSIVCLSVCSDLFWSVVVFDDHFGY